MVKKNITLDDLAIMVQKGFIGVDKRFEEVDRRFNEMDKRFDKLERLILIDHRQRIEKLEMDIMDLKNLFALK